jgi:hypothetical protein
MFCHDGSSSRIQTSGTRLATGGNIRVPLNVRRKACVRIKTECTLAAATARKLDRTIDGNSLYEPGTAVTARSAVDGSRINVDASTGEYKANGEYTANNERGRHRLLSPAWGNDPC